MIRSGLFRRFAITAVAVVSAGAFTGCASKPVIVPSTGPHAATSVEQVKIYEKAPKKYEILGTVTVSREEGAKWDARGDANAGFDVMLKKAAALGANGVLIWAEPGESDRFATAGYHGKFYQVPLRGTPGVALSQAIYVHEK